MARGRFYRSIVPVCILLLLSCTELKPVTSASSPGPSTSPTATAVPTPVPFPSPSPTATPTPTPTPVPGPTITLTSPTSTQDFTQSAITIAFTAVPQSGRTLASVSVAYNGAVLYSATTPGPSFSVSGWNPNQANNLGKTADTTTVPSGPQQLTITAVDNAGASNTFSLPFNKPLSISGWTQLNDMPGATSHMQVLSDGAVPPTFVSIWGSVDGVETNVVPRTNVYALDPAASGVWTTEDINGTGIPVAMYGLAVHPSGQFAYICGGRVGNQDVRAIDVFTPLRRVIAQSAVAMANARHDPAAAVYNNTLYVMGGSNNGSPLYAVEGCPIGSDGNPTGTFAPLANTLNARVGANAIVENNKIWLIGGGFNTIEVYDPSANSWSILTNAQGQTVGTPQAWSYSAMVPVGPDLYFFGGTREDGQPMTEIYDFSTQTLTWRDMGPLPAPLQGLTGTDMPNTRMGAFYANNAFYLIGGENLPSDVIEKHVFKAATL